MLRRKLLIRLGVLVAIYIAGAVGAIVLLQGVIGDLDAASASSEASAESIDRLEASIVVSREVLEDAALSEDAARRLIADAGARVRAAYERVGAEPIASGEASESYGRIGRMLDGIAPPEVWLEGTGLASWRQNAPGFVDALLAEVAVVRRLDRAAAGDRQLAITRDLRGLIIGLTVAALIALNVTIVLLLSTGEMIVRPVEALVEHSEALAREEFDHRVETPGAGEFGALAESYNALAERLSLNEQRKMEVLQQVGVSLNHELNNVINIIELQLESLDRHARGDEALRQKLTRIGENLHRIARTVASLKDVRRIVVTEYAEGMTMLDLPGCTADEGAGDAGDAGARRDALSETGRP
jgi:HAMP domain-containing protein